MISTRRKVIDKAFTAMGIFSIILMVASLGILLAPIMVRGSRAFIFRETVEFRKMLLHEREFRRGDRVEIARETERTAEVRKPVYDMLARFETEAKNAVGPQRAVYRKQYDEVRKLLRELLGPLPGEAEPVLPSKRYGETRWDLAQEKLGQILTVESWDYSDPTKMGLKVLTPRVDKLRGTALEPMFPYLEGHLSEMLEPRLTFYWRFLTDASVDSHYFGGIWAEMLGTIYLTVGAMIFAIPMGVIAAVYLVEYAGTGGFISFIRTCISTLAGVPSIVFGLFGLAFFINTLHVSTSKSVLAGAMTLALLVLPTIIRASEEAIRSVPNTYREAALALGAGKWGSIIKVVLPSALPGILTGIVISMGRAAGETAPIMFVAAVSVGKPLALWQTLSEPTPALSWNIYNMATEHEAIDQLRHVQYGMVTVLVMIVLALSLAAILLRAGISKKLRG